MKADLAPKHATKVGSNNVLWFESSNSYIIVSESSYRYLKSYLNAENQEKFIQRFHTDSSVSKRELLALIHEFSVLLEEMNVALIPSTSEDVFIKIPEPYITKQYNFGDSNISINYSSDKVLQLIHPHLHHGIVENITNNTVTFDIFAEQSSLYLFKNRSFVGSYDTKNFHFLQGKFAMEILDVLYPNNESNWLATFHASTICNDKEAIMIIGDSGNGKSTLSALLMAAGYDLLADDFTPMFADNQHLYRYPAAISIKKGAFAVIDPLFEAFNDLEPKTNSSKQLTVKYLPPSKPFESAQKHFECRKVVLVKYSQDAKSELKEIPSEKLLNVLIPDAWISPDSEHSKKFLNWLSQLSFYELSYSSNDFAIDKFGELFQL